MLRTIRNDSDSAVDGGPTPSDRPLTGLRLEGISHRFGSQTVVEDLSLAVESGELVCLLGPSGCGKTTTLRLAAGLEPLQQGRVLVADREVARPGRQLPPEERGVGLVFQDYALFPHLTVLRNVAFGLSRKRPAERRTEALQLLERLHMQAYARSYPHMLSGGEQQRVALARALAPRPAVMLMDEPFSNLDIRLRDAVRDDTLGLLKEEGAATLLVTHEPEEAMRMADRIVLMRAGRVVQEGTPDALYSRPNSLFAARFFSEINCLDGIVEGSGQVLTPLGPIAAEALPGGTRVHVVWRPEALRIDGAASGSEATGAQATVADARSLGPYALVALRLQSTGVLLKSRMAGGPLPPPGAVVGVSFNARETFVFPADGA